MAKEQQPSLEDERQGEDERRNRVLRGHNLPTSGDFPFIPPKHWRPSQAVPKNSQGEYIDIKGRRWRKGPSRTEGETWEWDVQLPNGDHLNIDWGGTITHPKPKSSRGKKGTAHRGLGGKGNRRKPRRKK